MGRAYREKAKAEVGLHGPPLPTRFSVLIGEIVHQFRSGLDHLLWQLVLVNRCQPHSRSEFPIFSHTMTVGREVESRILSGSFMTWIESTSTACSLARSLPRRIRLVSLTSGLPKSDTPPPYVIPPRSEVDERHYPVLSIRLKDVPRGQSAVSLLFEISDYTKRVIESFVPEFQASSTEASATAARGNP